MILIIPNFYEYFSERTISGNQNNCVGTWWALRDWGREFWVSFNGPRHRQGEFEKNHSPCQLFKELYLHWNLFAALYDSYHERWWLRFSPPWILHYHSCTSTRWKATTTDCWIPARYNFLSLPCQTRCVLRTRVILTFFFINDAYFAFDFELYFWMKNKW